MHELNLTVRMGLLVNLFQVTAHGVLGHLQQP